MRLGSLSYDATAFLINLRVARAGLSVTEVASLRPIGTMRGLTATACGESARRYAKS